MPTGLSLIETEIDSDDPNQEKKGGVCWVTGDRPTERQTLDLENG